jgi:hypothetical protein
MAHREDLPSVKSDDPTGQRAADGNEEAAREGTSATTEGTVFAVVTAGAKALVAGKQVSDCRSVFGDGSSAKHTVPEGSAAHSYGEGGFAADPGTSGGGSAGGAGGSGSGAANEKERELADVNGAWLDTSNLRASLENTDSRMEDGKASDEFEANRKLTGRRATDDEDLYTTSILDASKVSFKGAVRFLVFGFWFLCLCLCVCVCVCMCVCLSVFVSFSPFDRSTD